MGSYMSNSFLNSLHEKLESLLIDQTVKKSVQIYAGQILGEGLLMFYQTSLARIKMFVSLLSQLDSGERLSSGQEVLLSYSLMLFTRRDIGKKRILVLPVLDAIISLHQSTDVNYCYQRQQSVLSD